MRRIALIAAAFAIAGASAPPASAAVDPLRPVQWALDAIHLDRAVAPAASAAAAGGGAIVAVIDSGVDADHPELRGRVIAGPDLVDGDDRPDDLHGHGTHIAGIIAAASNNGIGGAGIAPTARILAIRVLDATNNGSVANVAAGIDAAVAARADVINLSLNWPQPSAALAAVTAAMRRAAQAGIAVIVAAGNDAQGRCEEPVLPQLALCVGALDDDLRLATFSSYGAGLSLVAPGERILSSWRGGEFARLSGTSQAAAAASGVAALLVDRGLHGQAVLDRLVLSARDIGDAGPDPRTGNGLLDADRAVDGAAEGRLAPQLRLRAVRRASQRGLRRRGLRVSCDAARPGTCRVRIRVRGRTVARGSARVDGTGVVKLRARVTKAGLRLLRGRRTMRGVIIGSLPGAPGSRRSITLRAR